MRTLTVCYKSQISLKGVVSPFWPSVLDFWFPNNEEGATWRIAYDVSQKVLWLTIRASARVQSTKSARIAGL